MLELRERHFRSFLAAPGHAYGKDSAFTPVFDVDLERFLDAKKNPLLQRYGALTYFTALRDGVPVGRITAHVHTASNQRHGWNRSCFGYFDCADDPDAAALLLDASEKWGRDRGHDEIWGSFNLTAMGPAGIVTDGFEHAPYSDQVWNPPHIPRLLEANGYAPEFPMRQFEADLVGGVSEVPLKPEQRALLSDSSLQWERVQAKGLDKLLPEMCDVLNDSFAGNPMFVPMSHEEFHFAAKDLSWVIDPRISSIVRENGELVGMLLCVPDLNPLLRRERSHFGLLTIPRLLLHRRRCKRAVVIIQGVRQRLHRRGLGAVMLHQMLAALRAAGYEKLGVTWIADGNEGSLRGAARIGAVPTQRLHLFRKSLC